MQAEIVLMRRRRQRERVILMGAQVQTRNTHPLTRSVLKSRRLLEGQAGDVCKRTWSAADKQIKSKVTSTEDIPDGSSSALTIEISVLFRLALTSLSSVKMTSGPIRNVYSSGLWTRIPGETARLVR